MKINIFQGDLTDVSARKEALAGTYLKQQVCNSGLFKSVSYPEEYTILLYLTHTYRIKTSPTYVILALRNF